MINLNQRAPCDNARISHWAATSATGLETPAYGFNCTTYASDLALTSVAPPASGAYPNAYSDGVPFPSCDVSMDQTYVPDMNYDESSTYSAGVHFSRMNISQGVSQGQALNSLTCFDGQDILGPGISDFQSYGLPGDNLVMESDASMAISGNTNEYDSHSNWKCMHDISGVNTMGNAQSTDWSSSIAMTPSTSSLPSEHSYLGQQPDTPVSAVMFDGIWTTTNGSMDGDLGIVPPFTIGDTAQMQPSVYYDDERLAFYSMLPFMPNTCTSTIRQNQSLARPQLTMDTFSPQDFQAYGLPQHPVMDGSRRNSESEHRNARDHAYYRLEAQKDGLYHCPLAATEERCTHKPEKLKCNYEYEKLNLYRCYTITNLVV